MPARFKNTPYKPAPKELQERRRRMTSYQRYVERKPHDHEPRYCPYCDTVKTVADFTLQIHDLLDAQTKCRTCMNKRDTPRHMPGAAVYRPNRTTLLDGLSITVNQLALLLDMKPATVNDVLYAAEVFGVGQPKVEVHEVEVEVEKPGPDLSLLADILNSMRNVIEYAEAVIKDPQ